MVGCVVHYDYYYHRIAINFKCCFDPFFICGKGFCTLNVGWVVPYLFVPVLRKRKERPLVALGRNDLLDLALVGTYSQLPFSSPLMILNF